MADYVIKNFKYLVEIPLLLAFFTFMLSDAVFTNLIIYRTCYITLGYNRTECALLGSEHKSSMTHHLEEIVEPHASVITMTRSFVEGLVTAIICLFIGPWSDRFGRKPLILYPLIGYSLSFIGTALLNLLPYASPWLFALTIIPIVMTGGFAVFLTGVLSYITDTTTEVDRGVRMGLFEATLGLGILLGNITSPYMFYAFGYVVVFAVCCGCCVLAALFTYFCIPESLSNVQRQGHVKEFFQVSHLKDMFKVTVKKRHCFGRGIILCCILMLGLYILLIYGSTSVMFLYLREKFRWSLKKFTLFNSVSNVIYISGTLFGVYVLHKLLKVTESVLILMGFISVLNCALLQGLATKDWHIYFSTAVHGISGVISPMIRSLISKLVDTEEVAKIFSVIVVTESVVGMIGSPLYTAIYNSTIKTNPGLFNFVSAGIYTFNIFMTLIVIWMQYKRLPIPYDQMNINEAYEDDENEPEVVINEDAVAI